MKSGSPYRCIGFWGRIVGHQFVYGAGLEKKIDSNFCYRCGMPKGGWDMRM